MLAGCKIKPQTQGIPHSAAKISVWKKNVELAGATLLDTQKNATTDRNITHILVGDTPSLPATSGGSGSNDTPFIVHYTWLEGCLAKKRRLSEADYHPSAIAEAVAALGSGASDAQPSNPSSGPSRAAIAAAAAAAASAAANSRPLLRQLSLQTPTVTAANLQQLLLHLLTDRPRPHWLSVHGRPSTVVVVELPGLDRLLLAERPALLPQLTARCKQQVTLRPSAANEVSSQTTATVFSVPQPVNRNKFKRQRTAPPAAAAAASPDATATGGSNGEQQQQRAATAAERAFPATFYTVTAGQMRVLGWPQGCAKAAEQAEEAGTADDSTPTAAAAQALPPGWVSTAQRDSLLGSQAAADTAAAAMIAVDCEMVITADGFVLARVSLVDGGGARLLDQLVVPDGPVLDYNTRYSGITADMLAGVTARVADAQRMVLQHIGPHTLLVGHTLENDLKALKLVHGRCIDSAVLYPNPRGLPHRSSLRFLATRLLGRTIQEGSHDSFVDAEVALQAVKLKLKNGPSFATAKQGCTHLLGLLASRGRRLALVGPRELLMLHATLEAQVVPASSDSQAIAAALHVLGSQPDAAAAAAGARGCSSDTHTEGVQQRAPPPELLWVQLADLWGCLQSRAADIARQAGTLEDVSAKVAAAQQDQQPRSILRQADTLLAQLAAALPPGGLLLVVSGQGDTALCRALQGEGCREKEVAQARQAAAKACHPVQALSLRVQQGVCMVALS